MGAGKRPRVVGLEDSQTTQPETPPQPAGHSVLACIEAACKDQPSSPVEVTLCTQSTIVSASEQCEIIDLYSTEDVKSNALRGQPCRPFLQNISLAGPNGENNRVKALFDEGAMVSAMCTSVFNHIKHRLGNWEPSTKKLRMANGTITLSKAVWRGEITLGGVMVQGEFKVFRSGGGWKFLLGKPLLRAFKAVHNYDRDKV